ncbi:MAG: mucoidy inhibitor MuiA family protein [Pseudomonadota bacterium]
MRPPVLLALPLALLAMPCVALTNAPVTAVTLYPGSATVTRSAPVMMGATEVVIGGLPANFNPETLRVQAGPGIRIGEVVTQDAAASEPFNPAEAALAARIEALKDQHALLEAESKSAKIVKSYLERFNGGAGPADKPGAGVDAKALAGLINTLGHGASEALVKIQKLAVQQRGINKQVEALQRDLERLKTGATATRAVTVRIAAGQGGALTLSYQLDNAGWKPGYRAALDSATSKVDLERLATIAQSTGEDWSNVKLTLSTSRPRLSPSGAEAQPWLLSWQALQPYLAGKVDKAMAPAAPAPMAEMAQQRARVNDAFVAEIQGTYATQFDVPGRVSLASDGREVTVSLASQVLAVKQHLQVTPRLENFAIVMAEAPRPEGVWPAGNMQLFRDGSYIGAQVWNLQDAKRAEFAFGRDDLVKVQVDAVAGMSGSKGLFGGRASRNTADVFTLVNRHKTAIDVIVLESSPVATSEEIKVQATFAPKPEIDAWEQRRGVVAWKKKMAPGETSKFNVEYRIDYPKEGQLLGLR